MLALSISGATLVHYASTNARSASDSHSDEVAFALSEAGINDAMAVLSNIPPNDPLDPALLAERTETLEGGTVTWSGILTNTATEAFWRITSTGAAVNPSGPTAASLKRTLTAKVPLIPVLTQPLAVSSWNYVFSTGTGDPDGCDMDITSSVTFSSRLLVAGNLCLYSSSKFTGSNAQLLVGGQVKPAAAWSGTIGQSGAGNSISRVDVAGGCKLGTNPLHAPCLGPAGDTAAGHADKVWANAITTSPEALVAPVPDYNGWYSKASPGPMHPCMASSGTPPVFDNDTARNRSVAGTLNLTPTSSYTCTTSLGGNPLGEISWNDTTNVMTVRGTIFIDGNAYLSQAGTYTGLASLYLSGSFYDDQKFCVVKSAGACDNSAGAWDPNANLLTIVAGGGGGQANVGSDTSVEFDSSGQWQGAVYGGAYFIRVTSSFQFGGPLIADEVSLGSSVQSGYFLTLTSSPTGMPGNSTVYAKPDKLQLFSG
jgi:hypothetical protein